MAHFPGLGECDCRVLSELAWIRGSSGRAADGCFLINAVRFLIHLFAAVEASLVVACERVQQNIHRTFIAIRARFFRTILPFSESMHEIGVRQQAARNRYDVAMA